MKSEIRKAMNLLESVIVESYEDAISDLESEGGENPSIDLAKEIADDYGLDPNVLMQKFNAEMGRKENLKKSDPKEIEKQKRAEAEAKQKAEREKEAAELKSQVNPEHVKKVEDFIDNIKTPDGFKREEGLGNMAQTGEVLGKGGSWHSPIFTEDQQHIVFKSDDIEIIINVTYHEAKTVGKGEYPASIEVVGHTNFKTAAGNWRTFTRRGIDIGSFHAKASSFSREPEEINEIVQEQIKRAKDAILKTANNIPVPGLPGKFTIDAGDVSSISKKLKAGETHTFQPGGMGTGYTLSTKPLHAPMGGFNPSPQGPKELADFFNVPKIYVTQQDFD